MKKQPKQSKTIRVDTEVFEYLRGKAEAFSSPNDTLRKIFKLDKETASAGMK